MSIGCFILRHEIRAVLSPRDKRSFGRRGMPRGKRGRGSGRGRGRGGRKEGTKPTYFTDAVKVAAVLEPVAQNPEYFEYSEDRNSTRDADKIIGLKKIVNALAAAGENITFGCFMKAHDLLYKKKAAAGLWSMSTFEKRDYKHTMSNRCRALQRHVSLARIAGSRWLDELQERIR